MSAVMQIAVDQIGTAQLAAIFAVAMVLTAALATTGLVLWSIRRERVAADEAVVEAIRRDDPPPDDPVAGILARGRAEIRESA